METEEREQIPWAHLVAEAEQPVDKRLYLIAGVVAVVALAFIGLRFFGNGDAPVTPPYDSASAANDTTATVAVAGSSNTDSPTTPPTTVGAVTEADLMAELPMGLRSDNATFIAEWFVTDFYTRDGSAETAASLRARVGDSLVDDLPTMADEVPTSFVEWARAFEVEDLGTEVEVSVGYRTVTSVEGGFVRDPVDAVRLTLVETVDGWTVVELPVPADLP